MKLLFHTSIKILLKRSDNEFSFKVEFKVKMVHTSLIVWINNNSVMKNEGMQQAGEYIKIIPKIILIEV